MGLLHKDRRKAIFAVEDGEQPVAGSALSGVHPAQAVSIARWSLSIWITLGIRDRLERSDH
jgi:hypothetical protein